MLETITKCGLRPQSVYSHSLNSYLVNRKLVQRILFNLWESIWNIDSAGARLAQVVSHRFQTKFCQIWTCTSFHAQENLEKAHTYTKQEGFCKNLQSTHYFVLFQLAKLINHTYSKPPTASTTRIQQSLTKWDAKSCLWKLNMEMLHLCMPPFSFSPAISNCLFLTQCFPRDSQMKNPRMLVL